jgi:hypothetical protein
MRYLLTICADESLARAAGLTLTGAAVLSPDSEAAMSAEYAAFMAEMSDPTPRQSECEVAMY